ncbi:MAG: MogA/MoaB family molybdenum cofactor biosynthesis protein [Candidatus Saliniplasma sp.]
MGVKEHKHEAPEEVRCAVVTVSDTRDRESDESGKLIKKMLKEEGHGIVSYSIVKDELSEIKNALCLKDPQVFILNGGTGISGRDVTPEAVRDIIDTEIHGFGELFRRLSYEEIGSAAMLSRALAGANDCQIVFALPGSKAAVELGMRELILPELGHLVYEANK